MRNVICENAWRKEIKLKRKSYARLCRVIFWQAIFFFHKFEGATVSLAQTNKAEKHVGVHEDYGENHL